MRAVRFKCKPSEVEWAYVSYLTGTGSPWRTAELRWNGSHWVAALPYGAQVMSISWLESRR